MQVDQLKSNQGEVMDGPLLITPSAFGTVRWFLNHYGIS